jgi:hypothetical protein
VVRLVRPGGTVCFFWNFDDLDPSTQALVDGVYERLAPEVLQAERAGQGRGRHAESLRATGCFRTVREQTYPYDETLPREQWIGRIGTYSRNLLLGARLAEVQDALRAAVPATVRLRAGTYAIWAQP